MRGDFSRFTFDPTQHYSRVMMQQGRVMLDADWNEQNDILLHYLRQLAMDLMGRYRGPSDPPGFSQNLNHGKFNYGAGAYYVDGIRCEVSGELEVGPLESNKSYLVYLDVWESHVTHLDDEHIREKALGGADTSSRTQIVWAARLLEEPDKKIGGLSMENLGSDEEFDRVCQYLQPSNRGKMEARIGAVSQHQIPCPIPPESGYRGLENQLYRVEVHQVGDGKASFKWSRENASVLVSCSKVEENKLSVSSNRGNFKPGDWVEIIPKQKGASEEPGELIQLIDVDPETLTIDKSVKNLPLAPFKLRRWDQKGGAILIEGGVGGKTGWLELEHGIEVQLDQFNKDQPNQYRPGDYWLIPARVVTGRLEWEEGKALPPYGVAHHYAPLALLSLPPTGSSVHTITDLRRKPSP